MSRLRGHHNVTILQHAHKNPRQFSQIFVTGIFFQQLVDLLCSELKNFQQLVPYFFRRFDSTPRPRRTRQVGILRSEWLWRSIKLGVTAPRPRVPCSSMTICLIKSRQPLPLAGAPLVVAMAVWQPAERGLRRARVGVVRTMLRSKSDRLSLIGWQKSDDKTMTITVTVILTIPNSVA
jgi:hypothetical protein